MAFPPRTSRAVAWTALTLAFGCLAAESQAQRQRHAMPMADSTVLTVTAEDGVPEVPFELINNHLILPISINGSEPLDIALDTGMPAHGLALYGKPEVEALDLDIDPAIQAAVGGAGGRGKHMTARVAMDESASLPGLRVDHARIIVMPPLPDFSGYHDGIIGYSLFERFVVELDYDRRTMRLHDPDKYRVPSDAHVLPMTFENRLPYVTLDVTAYGGKPYDAEVVVDLGASHALSLNTDWSEKIVLPETTLTTSLGHGLSGPIDGQLGRVATVGLGGAELADVLVSFPVSEHQNPRGVDSLAGNLGSDILRRFKTTFDYSGGRMVLEPNESYREPFAYDRSGLRLLPGPRLKVHGVIAGSPAAEAGIQADDIVTHVDGKAVTGEDYGEVRDRLMSDGEVSLSISRGETTLDKKLVLRRLI